MQFNRLFESKAELTAESKAKCGAYFTVVATVAILIRLIYYAVKALAIIILKTIIEYFDSAPTFSILI